MTSQLWLILLLGVAGKSKLEPRKLPSRPSLSRPARTALSQKMEQHGLAMMGLVGDVVLLAYSDVESAAKALAAQPGLARPRADAPDTLNNELPTLFFDLQDQLHSRALTLADAAQRQSDADMSAAFSQLTATCVACHSAYLKGR